MSRKGKVEYVKQMPKFLQEFKAQNPEIDRNANLKAIAAAHEERDKAERPIREDELPVIVNLQEYESELKQDKLLYQELTGKDADNETQDETVRDDNEMHNEAVDADAKQKIVEVGVGDIVDRKEDAGADDIERETGRHIFRKRVHEGDDDGDGSGQTKKKKKKKKKKKAATNLLSFAED